MAAQLVRDPAEVHDVVSRTAYDRHRLEHRQLSTDSLEQFDPGEPLCWPIRAGL
jgi:hypothetical protein